MRRPIVTVLALAGTLALSACGDDEPEDRPTPRPAATRPAATAADTAVARPAAGDTAQGAGAATATPVDDGAAGGPAAGAPGAGATGAASGRASDRQRLYTVQVGAFMNADTAREWERRLAGQGLPTWVSMAEIGGRTFYRLRVGATAGVPDARRVGSILTARYRWPVWVAPLTPADQPPADVVERTRALLGAD